jgi:hypothetical protein
MNTMPGFTADACLYKSAGNYQMRATGFSAVTYSSVMPQLQPPPNSPSPKAFSGSRVRMQAECEVFTFDDVPYVCCPSDGGSWECLTML